jgi:hypothetical protein
MLRQPRIGMRRLRKDDGAAATTLVIGMALLLCAATVVFSRIAQAGDMRTQTQTAADAAALGAVKPLRDHAVELALNSLIPNGIGYWATGADVDDEAQKYAAKNNGDVVGKVHQTGVLGDVAKVAVASGDCQLKKDGELTAQERKDLAEHRNLCTDKNGRKGIGRRAKATAIAKVIMPECRYHGMTGVGNPDGGQIPAWLECGGVRAWPGGDRAALSRVFKIRLVDKEDPMPYTGLPYGAGPTGPLPDPGPLPPGTPEQVRRAIAFAYAQLGTWYQWGGSCTSPSRVSATPGNCDCSSLTQMAYRAAGIAIPRTTYTQWPFVRHIPPSQVKEGDLVFFHPGPSGPEHVAIVVDAKNHIMIEAPHTGARVRRVTYDGRNPMGFGRPYDSGA